MQGKTQKNCHALYSVPYHRILVTKYRKPCITEEIFRDIKSQTEKVYAIQKAEIEEMSQEPDHVHILFHAPPQARLSSMINSRKSTTSRLVRVKYKEHCEKYYRKPYFWSRTYLLLRAGGAPIEVIKKYIREQGTPEHRAKKKKATNPA